FPDLPVDHEDRRGGVIVVVKAGVLILAPADHPGINVFRFPDLFVNANVAAVPDQMLPPLRGRGQAGDKSLQLGVRKAHTRASSLPDGISRLLHRAYTTKSIKLIKKDQE